jgi:hypothetical protein
MPLLEVELDDLSVAADPISAADRTAEGWPCRL